MTSLVLSALLILGIVALAYLRHGQGGGVWAGFPFDGDLVFAGLYISWILAEAQIAGRDVATEGKKTLDFGTCQFYALGQAGTFLTALWFPSLWMGPHATHAAGILLFLGGCFYRLWAIQTLGRFYSHRVRMAAHHEILDSGPYRFVRHPAYAGMVASNAGLSLFFFNWVTLTVFLAVLVPGIVLRILVEERMLFGIAGYSDFARTRKRLIPATW